MPDKPFKRILLKLSGESLKGEKSHGIDLGSTFLITNIIQMDLSGGILLNDTESKFIDIGLSVRLPN